MAFSESTAVANITAFIIAFINFAVAEAGFSNEGTTVDGDDTIYHIAKGGVYWNFMTDNFTQNVVQYGIYARMSFAKVVISANMKNTNPQAGQRQPSRMSYYGNTGPFVKYFLYTEGIAVHCVLQIFTGVFTHLSFGNMIKFGTWTGGEYLTANSAFWVTGGVYNNWEYQRQNLLFDGGSCNLDSFTYPVGYVRHIVGTQSDDQTDFARIGFITVNNQQCRMVSPAYNVKSLIEDFIDICGPIGYNVRAPLFPVYVRMIEVVTGRWILSGYVPGARVLNVLHLTGESIVENDWIVFPMIQKTGGDPYLAPLSDYWGVAYKREA